MQGTTTETESSAIPTGDQSARIASEVIHHHHSHPRFCGTSQQFRRFSPNGAEVNCPDCGPSIVAMTTRSGTACHETANYLRDDSPEWRAKIEAQFCKGGSDDPIPGSWVDVSDNDAFYDEPEQNISIVGESCGGALPAQGESPAPITDSDETDFLRAIRLNPVNGSTPADPQFSYPSSGCTVPSPLAASDSPMHPASRRSGLRIVQSAQEQASSSDAHGNHDVQAPAVEAKEA